MKKIFILMFCTLYTFSCIEKPVYIEVEGRLDTESYNSHGGNYYIVLKETGVMYDWMYLKFTEPITNLGIGVKFTNYYEVVYKIYPKNKEEINKYLRKRVKVKGEEYIYR